MRLPFRQLWILIVLLLTLSSCSDQRSMAPRAFYHWQTHFNLSQAEKDYLTQLQVKRIYAKYFDVDWKDEAKQAVPRALIRWEEENPPSFEIVPVVFITNRTLQRSKEDKLSALAHKITQALRELRALQKLPPIPEVQIDCDWSESTRDKYFKLLEEIQKEFPEIPITATIRLHQVKYYERTGVPPVDRGMLMYYNMGQIQDTSTQNSILDNEIARGYHKNFDSYPLPLDLILPAWSWALLFRKGQLIKIINRLRMEDLSDTERYEKLSPGQVKVKQSHYLEGHYLYQGDVLRVETVEVEDLQTAASDLNSLLKTDTLRVAIYPIDSQTTVHYPHEKLENIYRSFHP